METWNLTTSILNNDLWKFELNVSDNPYLIVYTGNESEVLRVESLITRRMNDFIDGNTREFITSDIEGMSYFKK